MKIVVLILFIMATPFFHSEVYSSEIEPSDISPHELAYQEAKYVVHARVISFDTREGLYVEVLHSIRGDITIGEKLNVWGTKAFPFMNKTGTNLTLFLQGLSSRIAELWSGPTTGGLLWNDDTTIYLIAAALANPSNSIFSENPREKFSAAYYLAVSSKLSIEYKNDVVKALIWGLGQERQEINQGAVDALRSINIDVQRLAGPYHPGYKLSLKKEVARKLSLLLKEMVTEKSGN